VTDQQDVNARGAALARALIRQKALELGRLEMADLLHDGEETSDFDPDEQIAQIIGRTPGRVERQARCPHCGEHARLPHEPCIDDPDETPSQPYWGGAR
jgi:hypothetical protein